MTCARTRSDPTSLFPRRAARGRGFGPRALLATLVCWRRRAADRRALARMEPHRWTDIARDPDAVRREIQKPFWRP
jgi:uncharacterized protein YjiS (DUF1127 family)